MIAAPFDPDALIEAMAPLLRLTLTAESRAQIVVHLRIAAEQSRSEERRGGKEC